MGEAEQSPRFVVDRMLGRLARWLRVLGHDVAYGAHLGGRTAVGCARRDGRVLLTRDTRLLRDPHLPPHLFITSDRFRDQLREVAGHFALGTGDRFRRCLECNQLLEEVSREQARDRVPPYVWAAAARFLRCAHCARLYWPATHQEHMRRELEALGLPQEGHAP
jgi:uncharacterized protein with PIN domain